jgi:hypothetical protein
MTQQALTCADVHYPRAAMTREETDNVGNAERLRNAA